MVSRDTAVCTPSVSCSGILRAAFAVSQVSRSILRCLNTAVYVLKLWFLCWVAINDNAWVYQCLDHVGSSRTCSRYNDCSGHNAVDRAVIYKCFENVFAHMLVYPAHIM